MKAWGIVSGKEEMTMQETLQELKARLLREAFERAKNEPPPPPPQPPKRTSVHYSELTEDHSSDPAAGGWNVYVREVGRLIAEGHEGKWVVIAGDKLIGVYDTEREADLVTITEKLLSPPVIKQVREQEPIRKLPFWYKRCRN